MSARPSPSLPSYVALAASGELKARAAAARLRLTHCDLCPRACGVNRLQGETGFCRAEALPRVASWNAHHGEEPPISGRSGSGTIFFSNCTGRCLFCQNYPISQLGNGQTITDERLASMMLELQRMGCHNINLVTPTHYVPQILQATERAAGKGLRIPLVYNTSGYERVDTLELLDGVIDIYLPDAKYADDTVARELSGFDGYVQADRAALREMRRQVGSALQLDDQGIAIRGMVIRHLVLPDGLAQTRQVLAWIARELGTDIFVSLMAQYFPAYRASEHPPLDRRITRSEYHDALRALEEYGLDNGWRQHYTP
jgi:putative pyruvate formate lyase activating enzyme